MFDVKITRKQRLDLVKGTRKGAEKAVEAVAAAIEAQSVANAPVDKGALRGSITRERRGLKASVGSNLVYAAIREFGGTIRAIRAKYLTFKYKGKWVRKKSVKQEAANGGVGYLRPAVIVVRRKLNSIVGRAIRSEIRKSK